jgi:hypothetical protein
MNSQRVSPWVPIAFAVTGSLVGFLAGESMTPVVGALLPLLFGLIGGGSGFFATYKPEYSRAIGVSLSILSFFCLLGVISGIRLREGIPWRCAISVCDAEADQKFDLPQSVQGQEQLMELVSIKTILRGLDMDKKDKERIFNLALADAKLNDKSTRAEDFGSSSLSELDETLQRIAETQAKLKGSQKSDDDKRPHLKH